MSMPHLNITMYIPFYVFGFFFCFVKGISGIIKVVTCD